MIELTRRALLGGASASALLIHHQALAHILVGTGAPPSSAQNIASIDPTTGSFVGGTGSANAPIATLCVTMNPTLPCFAGTLSLSGGSATAFRINSNTGLLSVGPVDVAPGTYNFNVVATQAAIGNSPFTQPITITGTGATSIGYSVVVTMDSGPIYTFNPDAPDVHTTVSTQDNFVSPFAGFTQASVMLTRDDTLPLAGALRVYFRKDVSPDPTRIEIILELGKFTTNGSAANLGPFTLQILKAGVAQPIPYASTTNQNATSTSPHFPSMGWWTRWRWNPTPRAIVRTGAQLLPASLNLVPNFSATLASSYGALDTGVSGGPNPITAYSSAWAAGQGSNLNPVGVNEPCNLGTSFGGTGGRPELGVVTEYQGNWIVNGNAAALAALKVWGEVDGGIPWHVRDSSTNWASVNFFTTPLVGWFPSHTNFSNPPYTMYDMPTVFIPSGGIWDISDQNHLPALTYIPYVLTGDPYYLQGMQDKVAFLIGCNFFHRGVGYQQNYPDRSGSPTVPIGNQSVQLGHLQLRGFAWAMRDLAQCYLATPSSTLPNWLQPQSYYKSLMDSMQTVTDEWSVNYATLHSGSPQYPGLQTMGMLPVCNEGEYGLYEAYTGVAFGFLVNQAGQSNWLPQYNWITKPLVAWNSGDGVTGWDKRWWPATSGAIIQPVTNDYTNAATITPITSFIDSYTFQKNAALLQQANNNGWTANDQTGGMAPIFGAWQANHAYHCNSWVYQMRAGAPTPPNAGDIVTITISGSFSGSPVTLSHTLTTGDVNNIIQVLLNFNSPNQVTDGFVSQINANATLSTAGIKASNTIDNAGVGAVGDRQYTTASGRFYISFNSDGTSSLGGPVIGNIVVSGTFTTSGLSSVYCQPNGDGVTNGVYSSALFGRSISYQCATSGLSGGAGGPTGTALQTLTALDGAVKWCYAPEYMSCPFVVPGGPQTAFPAPGFGGVYGFGAGSGQGPQQRFWAAAGLASAQTAGVTGAAAARANVFSQIDYLTTNQGLTPEQYNFSIVPYSPVVVTSP